MPDTIRTSRPAFTLIEVLVVVAIIALLIAILMPSLASARNEAKKTQCMSNQRQLAAGHYYYTQDYRGKLPHTEDWLYTGGWNSTTHVAMRRITLECIAIGSWIVNSGRQTILKLALPTKRRTSFIRLFDDLAALSPPFRIPIA